MTGNSEVRVTCSAAVFCRDQQWKVGGSDGTRTRGLLRDRKVFQLGEAGCANVNENYGAKRYALRGNSGCPAAGRTTAECRVEFDKVWVRFSCPI